MLCNNCNLIFVLVLQQFSEVELPQTIKMPSRYNKGNPQLNKLDSCGPRKRLKLEEVEVTPAYLQAQLRRGVATVCVLVGYESEPRPSYLCALVLRHIYQH